MKRSFPPNIKVLTLSNVINLPTSFPSGLECLVLDKCVPPNNLPNVEYLLLSNIINYVSIPKSVKVLHILKCPQIKFAEIEALPNLMNIDCDNSPVGNLKWKRIKLTARIIWQIATN